MATVQVKKIFDFVRSSPALGSFPFSFMLVGVEEFIEPNLSCPCKYKLNQYLIASMFIGPSLLIFLLMFIMLRPFQNKCCQCCQAEVVEDDRQNSWNILGHCLIPPLIWIIVLFFDGDYLACCLTTWEGKYVFDEELNRMWCKPIEQANAGNQSDLRREFEGYIHLSKTWGYAVLGIFSVLIFIILGLYDCCISGKFAKGNQRFYCCGGQQDAERLSPSGKCDCLRQIISCCCKKQNVDQSNEHEGLPLQQNNPEPNTSNTDVDQSSEHERLPLQKNNPEPNTADEEANFD